MNTMTERDPSRGEDGFLLLGVLFMMLLVLLALSIAAPKIAESIRRDKEVETVHRGLQYAHAIQVFYAKTGRYPSSIDQLMKTDNQRFLRKRYLNPMTGKNDWRLIHMGEAKVPAMGLFGQTVQGGGITPTGATTGTNNGFGSPSSSGTSGSPFGSSGSSTGSGGFGSSGSSFGSTGSSFGSTGSAFGSSGSSTSPAAGTDGNSPTGTTTGAGTGFGSSPAIGGTTTTGSTSGAFGSPGATFGGAPIVGVGLLNKNTSIKIYKKQTHYNQWEFVFDPTQNTLQATAGAATNLNGASNGTSGSGGTGTGTGVNGGSGAGNGFGFGSGSGSGFGGSPVPPVNPPGTSQ